MENIPSENIKLIRTFKSWCPYCNNRSHGTTDNTKRFIPCMTCVKACVDIQRLYRGYATRRSCIFQRIM